MESKEIVRWQDMEALRRFQMIAPLVADGVDPARRVELRKELALSERSGGMRLHTGVMPSRD